MRLSNTEKVHRYIRRHPEQWKEYHRNYARNKMLKMNGHCVRVDKRPFYGTCEICGRDIEGRMAWHHWNNEHPEWGIWVHYSLCHQAVEAAEQFNVVIPIYSFMKKFIEEGGIP